MSFLSDQEIVVLNYVSERLGTRIKRYVLGGCALRRFGLFVDYVDDHTDIDCVVIHDDDWINTLQDAFGPARFHQMPSHTVLRFFYEGYQFDFMRRTRLIDFSQARQFYQRSLFDVELRERFSTVADTMTSITDTGREKDTHRTNAIRSLLTGDS